MSYLNLGRKQSVINEAPLYVGGEGGGGADLGLKKKEKCAIIH